MTHFDKKKSRHGLNYRFGAAQFMAQVRQSGVLAEKMHAAIIMQAWIDGYEVIHMFHDEMILEKAK